MTEATNTALALRPAQAARALGVSPRTLWAWTKSGIVPSVRVGNVIMYPVAELRAWLVRQAGEAMAPTEGKR